MKRNYMFHALCFSLLIIIFVSPLYAQEYILELQQIEATTEAQLQPSIPQNRLNEFKHQGYAILTVDHPAGEIAFSIDRTIISFDDLSRGGMVVEPIEMQVVPETGSRFQILAQLLKPFQSISGQTIEPTSCDDGCSVRIAKPWTSNAVYGWGYSVDGGKTYRPFSPEAMGFLPPELSSTSNIDMKLKVQTSTNQPEGNFQAVVQLIALPE